MHPPRIVLLALVAIGLASGASAAHAQFANVFVPEPGMLDAMCARGTGVPRLCLAQVSQDKEQRKNEISPVVAAAASGDVGSVAPQRSPRALAQRAEH
jgi:hypothetical protein